MKLLLIAIVMLTGCTTWQERMNQADANRFDYYQSLNDGGVDKERAYSTPDRNMAEYFACMARYGQRFNNADTRFICQ